MSCGMLCLKLLQNGRKRGMGSVGRDVGCGGEGKKYD